MIEKSLDFYEDDSNYNVYWRGLESFHVAISNATAPPHGICKTRLTSFSSTLPFSSRLICFHFSWEIFNEPEYILNKNNKYNLLLLLYFEYDCAVQDVYWVTGYLCTYRVMGVMRDKYANIFCQLLLQTYAKGMIEYANIFGYSFSGNFSLQFYFEISIGT